MDRRLVCPCGLTCCDCLFYQAEIFDAARKLKELVKKHDFDYFLGMLSEKNGWTALSGHFELGAEQAWEEIGKYFDAVKQIKEFMAVLDGIIDLQCRDTCYKTGGCSVGGNTHACAALKCLRGKGYEGCWQCGGFGDCDRLRLLKKNYGRVIEENLRTMREGGHEAIRSRGNRYYAWQRRRYGDEPESS